MIVAEGCGHEPHKGRCPWLQWGRNLIVAEGNSTTETVGGRKQLQWGRNLIVAEGIIMLRPDYDDWLGFNGAAT